MITLERLRIFFLISVVLIGVFRVYIPGRQEFNRQEKITTSMVSEYKDNSTFVDLPNFEKLKVEERMETYYDGTPFVRKQATRSFSFIREITTGLIYKIESYRYPGIISIGRNEDNVWVKVNRKEQKSKKGTMGDPIIALQYGFGTYNNPDVPPEDYDYNIREYLTYKDYTPPAHDLFYYLNMIWNFGTLFGLSITTGMSIRRERAEKQKAQA